MNDLWTNRRSEYLDGDLGTDEVVALEAHLATCGQCYATLGELRQVVARAQALQDTPPATDLWTGIAREIRRERPPELRDRPDRLARRRFSVTVGQLLAASIALIALSSGSAWLALHATRQPVTPVPDVASVPSPAAPAQLASTRWQVQSDMAIAELQDVLSANESKLDTATVRIVRENLAVIDRAIAQAQKALRRDPCNTYLNLHLANTMRQKIDLLRRANALAAGES
jgi:anti-sigma factor RsiW